MLLKANDVTEMTIDGVTYTAEKGLLDVPITQQEAILFGLEPLSAEELTALTEDSGGGKDEGPSNGTA